MAARRRPFSDATLGPFAFLWQLPDEGYQIRTEMEPIWFHLPFIVELPPAPLFELLNRALQYRQQGKQLDLGSWLVIPKPLGQAYYSRQYPPLSEPDLHRRFARLDVSDVTTIKRFADRFGMLTIGTVVFETSVEGSRPVFLGEPSRLWRQERNHIAWVIELWDLVREGKSGRLGQHIIWSEKGDRVTLERWHGVDRVIAARGHAQTEILLTRWRLGDVVGPARHLVFSEINQRLERNASPQVLSYNGGEIMIFPESLWAAIWLQFAMEVSGRLRPAIVCKGCDAYFIPLHGNQLYHDKQCRQRAYHRRKAA